MPYGDGTGPDGEGPMTGRGAGYCAGYDRPGFASPGPRGGRGFARGFGRGMGRGRGMGLGRGFRWRRIAPAAPAAPAYQYQPVEPTKEERIKALEAEKEDIEAELKEVGKLLEDLKKEKK